MKNKTLSPATAFNKTTLTKTTLIMSLLIMTVLSMASTCAMAADDGFVSLFNGKDLSGWTIRGGHATYNVEDGDIIGKCTPGTPGNTFLCTEKDYANFIFKLEFKFDVMGNSGIQVRSHARQNKDRQSVFGYQCEIADRVAIGQIYDEGRRAWGYGTKFRGLRNPNDWFAADAVRPYKAKQWNAVEIQCIGPSIRSWVNGVPCADLIDVMDKDGFIGLQVHAGGAGTLRWRNLQIKELPASDWKPVDDSFDANGDFAVRNGSNAFIFIADRAVKIENNREIGDTTDTENAAQMRKAAVEQAEKDNSEFFAITPEMKALINRDK